MRGQEASPPIVGKDTQFTLRLELVIAVVALAVSIGFNWQLVQTHIGDQNLHRTWVQLDDRYMPRRELEVQLQGLEGTANRIERILERKAGGASYELQLEPGAVRAVGGTGSPGNHDVGDGALWGGSSECTPRS